MRNQKRGIIILLLGMTLVAVAQPEEQSRPEASAYARENIQPRAMDRAVWEEAKKGMDFDRPIPQKAPIQKKDTGQSLQHPEIIILAIRLVVLLIALAALYFLIRSLMGIKTPSNDKVNGEGFFIPELEHIETNFMQMDLDKYIQEAIASGQYDLAVRFHYLQILKSLSLRGLIHWKREKTNQDYSRELRQTHLHNAFSMLTRFFDQVRYGDSGVTKETFTQFETQMHAFLRLLPNE